MPQFAPARLVHRTLARRFSVWAKPLGFRRLPGSTCAFARPREDGDGFVRFWVQISQWGSSWSGNWFCLNGQARASAADAPLADAERLLQFLGAEDVAMAEALEWHIVRNMPRPAEDHPIYEWMRLSGRDGEVFRRAYDQAFTHRPELFRPGLDLWFRYFSVEDIHAWADFLQERLPALLQDFETRRAGV